MIDFWNAQYFKQLITFRIPYLDPIKTNERSNKTKNVMIPLQLISCANYTMHINPFVIHNINCTKDNKRFIHSFI